MLPHLFSWLYSNTIEQRVSCCAKYATDGHSPVITLAEKEETQRCAVQSHSHDLKVCLTAERAKMVNQTPAQIEAYTGLKKIVNLSKCGRGREVNRMKQPQHSN